MTTPAQQRTDDMLAAIDRTLTAIPSTRSMWTTQQIEDLLLDIRQELRRWEDFEVSERILNSLKDEQA